LKVKFIPQCVIVYLLRTYGQNYSRLTAYGVGVSTSRLETQARSTSKHLDNSNN